MSTRVRGVGAGALLAGVAVLVWWVSPDPGHSGRCSPIRRPM